MKEEQDNAAVSAPKMKFKPKIPPRKQSKTAASKVESSETKNDLIDRELLTKLNAAKSDNSFGRRPRAARKSAPAQVAFGQGSSSLRSFGNLRNGVTGGKHEDGSDVAVKPIKEYVEPWDYVRTYYPISLPLRRPYSGDPEILDKEEFGEDSMNGDKKPAVPPAEELGLMGESTEPQMFLFQFPAALPLAKPPAAAADGEGREGGADATNVGTRGSDNRPDAAAAGSQRSGNRPTDADKKPKGCSLKDLPSGFIGKMLIYKSGKVKMKIGDALFDVSPGQDCVFAQDAAVINVKEQHCCVLGDLPKRAVVTPDVDSLLEAIENI